MAAERVQSVDRVFHLLEHLADANGSISLSELASLSGLPMPTVHRLLQFLVNERYARQESSKRYALGPRMIRLGESASRQLGPWATPHLARLVTKYGETANMAMLEGDACVYIAQVPSPQSMRMFTEVGRVIMLHSTGVGKAILSTLPDAQVVAILQRTGMPARTDQTITSPDQMLKTLRQIRQDGYAIDEGEQERGVRCVAVPITGLPFTAAASVSGPSSRITLDSIPIMAPDLHAVATDIREAFEASRVRAAS